MQAITEYEAQLIVFDAGGNFLGVQADLILFASRETGATLAMNVNKLLAGGIRIVRDHILKANARYASKQSVLVAGA